MTENEVFAQLVQRIPNLEWPKPGYVWAIRWYPGGRKELVEVEPTQVLSLDEALANLANNRKACVSLANAVTVAAKGY